MKKIVIANIYREKNKQSFFALHQIHQKIKEFDQNIEVEFHIIWDKPDDRENNGKWIDLINQSEYRVYSYDKQFFIDYAIKTYSQDENTIRNNFSNFFAIYVLLLFHYLRRVKLYDHCLRYDDDILINYDFSDVIEACLQNRSILISEPYNSNCDKVLLNSLIILYGGQEAWDFYRSRNPNLMGFNAGFQGIDLSIYDDFLSPDGFQTFLNLFNYKPLTDEDGKELWGPQRFLIETQEQSFAGVMNVLKSRQDPYILDPTVCYVAPNWGEHPKLGNMDPDDEMHGWQACLKSKISHFIGHTMGKGKPKEFLDRVDEYLKQNGYEI